MLKRVIYCYKLLASLLDYPNLMHFTLTCQTFSTPASSLLLHHALRLGYYEGYYLQQDTICLH